MGFSLDTGGGGGGVGDVTLWGRLREDWYWNARNRLIHSKEHSLSMC